MTNKILQGLWALTIAAGVYVVACHGAKAVPEPDTKKPTPTLSDRVESNVRNSRAELPSLFEPKDVPSGPPPSKWSDDIDKRLIHHLDDIYNADVAIRLPRDSIEKYVKSDIKDFGINKLIGSSYFSVFSDFSDQLVSAYPAQKSEEFDTKYGAYLKIETSFSKLKEEGFEDSRLYKLIEREHTNLAYSIINCVKREIKNCHKKIPYNDQKKIKKKLGADDCSIYRGIELLACSTRNFGLINRFCKEHPGSYASPGFEERYDIAKDLSKKFDVDILK